VLEILKIFISHV